MGRSLEPLGETEPRGQYMAVSAGRSNRSKAKMPSESDQRGRAEVRARTEKKDVS